MKIAQFLKPEDVICDLAAANKPQLLAALSRIAAGRLKLDADAITSALMQREALGSTGIGDGTALPHATMAGIAAPFALFARLASRHEGGESVRLLRTYPELRLV